MPAPKLTSIAVDVTGPPTTGATTLTAEPKCVANATCVFTTTATLVHAKATTPPQSVTLAPGRTQKITYTFDATAMSTERAASEPQASIAITATEPAPYTDKLTSPLSAATPGAA
jgi:hypothetical protein